MDELLKMRVCSSSAQGALEEHRDCAGARDKVNFLHCQFQCFQPPSGLSRQLHWLHNFVVDIAIRRVCATSGGRLPSGGRLERLRPPQATGAQPASFGPAAHNAPPAASTTSSAGASTSAERLSTLLLTDQDVLDVVLALHGIRAAQLCHLLPWPGSHPLKLPPPGKALAKQLSQSQRSVPGSQLLAFVKTLERDSSLKSDPLLRVWDSMHRAMLLVLAALQSLPIRPYPQHPDPAATTHTSSTTQLPPGYHRCSACLLLSLRLVLSVAQHCVEQPLDKDLALARLYATLPGLLLGLSTTLTVMEAAGHPEAQAQRVQFVRCLLHLGPIVASIMVKTDPKRSSNSSSRRHGSSRVQASIGGPRGDTGLSGASQSVGDELHALAVKSYIYMAQALWDVLGRKEEAFAHEELITTCQEEGSCDADFAADTDTRRITGHVFMLYGGAVSWSRCRQPTVAASTTESEYTACSTAGKEGLRLRAVLADLSVGSAVVQPVTIMCDNEASLTLIKHPIASARPKHIDVLHHFVRERVARGELDVELCGSAAHVADALIKALPSVKFEFCKTAAVSMPLPVSDIIRLLALCLPGFQAAVVALNVCAAVATVRGVEYLIQDLLEHFLTQLFISYVALRQGVVKLTVLMPDWRRRPAVLRTGLRVATAGALAHHTMVSLLLSTEQVNRVSYTNSQPSLLPATVQRLSEKEEHLNHISFHATYLWSLVLGQDGVDEPSIEPLNDTSIRRSAIDRVAVLPSPSSPQLAPLALDLVLGMENTLQMVIQQQDMVWKWPCWNDGNLVQSLADSYRTLLALFGHVIEVLATPSVVGPAGLAAQPASWLPCGNSLVEGWCTRLLAGVCKLMYIATPASAAVPLDLKIMLNRGLRGSYKLLLRGQRQAPPSMSPEAERLLSCLTLVLTAMLPQDLCLAMAGGVTDGVPKLRMTLKEENMTMSTALSKLQPEQVWTWQALAAGTPAEATLQGLLSAMASLYQGRSAHLHTLPAEGASTLDVIPIGLLPIPKHRAGDVAMKNAVLHLAEPAYTSQEQPGVCRIACLSCTSNTKHLPNTMTADDYVRRLEAACQLLHEGLWPPQATGAQPASFSPAAHNLPPAAPSTAASSTPSATSSIAAEVVYSASPPSPSAAGNTAAVELCTLLLTDQEVLGVVLALHDIRTAQLCHHLPWSGSHALKLPPPSEALAKQLSQSQWSVPGSQLLAFVTALDDDNSLEGDPLLRVWDSMHRAMLLVLAALQSLPIRPHPQNPDPAATTHTSTTTQLPPGYMHCSACLLLSLRLAICLAQHCAEQPLDKDLALARLHATLPRLLLGLSTAMTVMQAAGHPEAQAQRVQFVRCLLHLGKKAVVMKTALRAIGISSGNSSSNSSSRRHGSSRGQASSRGPHGDTGRSGAPQSVGDEDALAVIIHVYLAQALCDVLGHQAEAYAFEELISTCQEEGPGSIEDLNRDVTSFNLRAITVTSRHSMYLRQMLEDAERGTSRTSARVGASCHSATAVGVPLLVSDILSLLARCLPAFQAAVLSLKFRATVDESMVISPVTLGFFLYYLSPAYITLYHAVVKSTWLMPDWRRRPAVLRTGLRVATAGALAHNTMVSLLPSTEQVNRVSHTNSQPSLLPATVQRLSEIEEKLIKVFFYSTHLLSAVLAQVGVNESPGGPFQLNDDFINRLTADRVAVQPSPSSPQLAPLALDLVLGMENTLQMVIQQQDMVWKWPFWNDGNLVQGIADGYRTLLALFGHVIEVLATPSAVGPAGLAAQPASWLPCGNSLVEGWCTRLLAGVCKLMYIATPASTSVPVLFKIMLNRRLQGSYKLLLRGQRQAPLSMSPEAERLLSCLTLVLTAMLPQDLCLAMARGVADPVPALDMTLEKECMAMGVPLSKLEPGQVWTWQALAAGTPAELTLLGLLHAMASFFEVQGLVTPIAPGWRHQRLTLALAAYVRRLEAACQLLHEGLRPPQATGAQTASSSPAAHNVSPAASITPSAAASTSAGELCTLLLTDQEVLGVALALHDIRTAQLCHLLLWSGSHALKLPPPSEALAKQLSQSQRSVPGSQLLPFVTALEGDPLLDVWDSMHRTMLLVLAALQSLPICPHPQHPDPAATTHTSTTTQLPPGYHRCSACLLLSLRLVLSLAQHCGEQPLGNDQPLARLHSTLPGLLRGMSTTLTVMQAAGHPEAQAQRVQFVRCLLHLGLKVAASVMKTDPKFSSNSSSMRQASSRGPRGNTGWSGASQSAGVKLDALAVNSYGYLAQALWDVLGRQKDAFAHKELITTCQQEGLDSIEDLDRDAIWFGVTAVRVTYHHHEDLEQILKHAARTASRTNARLAASRRTRAGVAASRHNPAPVGVPVLVSDILGLLARFLPSFQAAVMALELCATVATVGENRVISQATLKLFLTCLSSTYFTLYQAVLKFTRLMPDWRRRPAVLRAGLRVATAGSLAHHTMVSLLPDAEHVNRVSHTTSTPCLPPATVLRLSEIEEDLSGMSFSAIHQWSLVLAQDGVNAPPTGPFQPDNDFLCRLTTDRVAVLPSPSLPQLAPLALDLVLGMENTLQMVIQQQDMVWKWPFWNDGNLVQSLADGYRTLLALFGHVIEVLATPSVVGPAGLAAQPASWLPCGNSLVEGWCTRLLAGVCKLMYIATAASADVPLDLKIMLNRRLQGSYRLLLRGQRQAPPSMSPEAERLLSCLTLVLTAMLPQDLCLALAGGVTDGVPMLGMTLEEENMTMSTALSKLQPEQVWTWQALAAGTPAEATLRGLLPALASLFQVQGLVTPIAPGAAQNNLHTLTAQGAGTLDVIPIGLLPIPKHRAGDVAMKDALLQLAGPAYTSQEQPGVCRIACLSCTSNTKHLPETMTTDDYVRRLEAACQLLHEGPQATGAQPASSCPAAHKVSPAASTTPSAGSSTSAVELCTLLLTDKEVLDVVLALHDVRSAQLCHLMLWPGSHALKLPPLSQALAKQLSQSQRSVPGSQLLSFVRALDSNNSLEVSLTITSYFENVRHTGAVGDPLLDVWDSMHRAMLLVLAALQSLPIHPHTQRPDPAATTHTSTTTQLPPGYMHCSACLLLSLRLAICLAQHCAEQPLDKDLALARLHATLPRLLLGLSTAMTVMQAACHPEAQAQRVQFVRCLLHLGKKAVVMKTALRAIGISSGNSSSNSSSRRHGSSRGQASSRGPHGDTGRSGAPQSVGDEDALAVIIHVYLAQALCDVLGHQAEAYAFEELISTCQEEGPGSIEDLNRDVTSFNLRAITVTSRHSMYLRQMLEDAERGTSRTSARVGTSCHSATAVGVPLLVSDILSLLARCLPAFQAAVLSLKFRATVDESMVISPVTLGFFLYYLSPAYITLYHAVVKSTWLMPDWRRRPAVLRTGLRVATAGALAHNTMVSLLPFTEQVNRVSHTNSQPSLLPATVQRLSEIEEKLIKVFFYSTHLLSAVLAQVGVNESPGGPFQLNDDFINRLTADRVAVQPSPSSPQLAPLALDLVLGMENTLQVSGQGTLVIRQQDMVWKWPFWGDGNLVQSIADGYQTLLALFGHVIEVLATPSVVGPAGLAAQPASWLPCGNSLVEGWCTRLLAGVCKLMYIATPASTSVPVLFKIMLNRRLRGSYKLLLRGQPMLPQDLCLAMARGVADPVPALDMTLEKECMAMGVPLSKLEPGQVWTWQALAAGTPAELTLLGLLHAMASFFEVQGLVTPIAPGWRHQRLTLALALLLRLPPSQTASLGSGSVEGCKCAYVRRLEAACQLLHEGLRPPQAKGAQPASSSPAAHNVSPAASITPLAAASTSAGELCTLLLTDQEVLGVALALHDIRTAQLCHLLLWSGSHALKLPPPSEALAKQLSQSQRSVPGNQLLPFVTALEGDPLLDVWDSMHRAMLLVLAALQSLPICPHPQHPDPAATTHTSTTTQLPPGYHRCSACLLLSLRLVLSLAQHCGEQPLGNDQPLARLHSTLPGLLRGMSTTLTVMQAAGHPEAQAQRVQFVRCLLHLGKKVAASVVRTDPKASSNSSSRRHGSSRGQASSRGPRGDTGRSGASQSVGDKLHALAVISYGYLAQALCDVLGHQEEAYALKELITTCQDEGFGSIEDIDRDVIGYATMALTVMYQHSIDMQQILEDAARATSLTSARVAASRHSAATVNVPLLVSDILGLLSRCLPGFQATVVAARSLSATIVTVGESKVISQRTLKSFLTCLSPAFVALYKAVKKLMVLMPDWRRRPAVLRAGLRVATAGALAHNTMLSMLLSTEHKIKMPHTNSAPSLLPATVQRLSETEEELIDMSIHVAQLWSLVRKMAVPVLPSPSSFQLVPLALDLVLGMEHTLQMVMRHQDMVWKWPFWNDGNLVQSLADGYRTLLALFGHVIEVLATPSVVGPAGLAAQPASWLPCGNSLVEGWCTRLLAGVCKLMCITNPASTAVPLDLKIMFNRRLQGSYKLLLRGQRQAPLSMSPEAERLLSCLTLVLTAMLPQDLCLAMARGVTDPVPTLDMTLEKECMAMGGPLSKLEPEQVWTWQALAAGTPAELTLQGLLHAMASFFQVQALVTPIEPGWRHQRLTVALDDYVRRLEAACQLLPHEGPQAKGAQPASSSPATHNVPPAAPSSAASSTPSPSAAGNTTAVELCTLLLTDQEVLDVALALHDIRAAQLCHLMPWPGSHALKLPPPSEALAQQLSQSQRSVPGSQLLPLVTALESGKSTISCTSECLAHADGYGNAFSAMPCVHASSCYYGGAGVAHVLPMQGDPLLRVWDSMHRAMLLVLAALQSLPIRSHPQHPDPAATTHTSATTQLPPGYMRCTACLFISLRLALRLSRHHMDTALSQDPGQARLHATLPGLLLGLSTAVTVMHAAGQREADAHRLLLVRCLLHLGASQWVSRPHHYFREGVDEIWQTHTPTSSCPDHLARLLASSPAVTGWPGPLPAKLSSEHSSTALASSGMGHTSGRSSRLIESQGSSSSTAGAPLDPVLWNTYAHLAQALCAVLWRQDEGFDVDLLLSAAHNQGRACACLSKHAVSYPNVCHTYRFIVFYLQLLQMHPTM
ncbi:hypothetical protein QJQ45_024401 [Haematococcus lacustris]|nr:hypothetical protein QJQ45_024401 [Haematococcus lacustris]